VGDARLYNYVGLYREDQLLEPKSIVRKLDNRSAQPREAVDVLVVPSASEISRRNCRKRLTGVHRKALLGASRWRDCHNAMLKIN
jgi:hypothetical protein